MPADGAAAIRAMLDAQITAWNAGDLEEFCDYLAEDAAYLNADGIVRGRDALFLAYRFNFPDAASMGHLSLTVDTLHVEGALATMTGRYVLTKPGLTQTGATLLTFVHRDGHWLLFQDATFSAS